MAEQASMPDRPVASVAANPAAGILPRRCANGVWSFPSLILMPIGLLAGSPAGQIEAILLHVLAHIRRYDYLVNVLQRLVEGLLFYPPAVWWISGVIRA